MEKAAVDIYVLNAGIRLVSPAWCDIILYINFKLNDPCCVQKLGLQKNRGYSVSIYIYNTENYKQNRMTKHFPNSTPITICNLIESPRLNDELLKVKKMTIFSFRSGIQAGSTQIAYYQIHSLVGSSVQMARNDFNQILSYPSTFTLQVSFY